jgi:hypothetical protein
VLRGAVKGIISGVVKLIFFDRVEIIISVVRRVTKAIISGVLKPLFFDR